MIMSDYKLLWIYLERYIWTSYYICRVICFQWSKQITPLYRLLPSPCTSNEYLLWGYKWTFGISNEGNKGFKAMNTMDIHVLSCSPTSQQCSLSLFNYAFSINYISVNLCRLKIPSNFPPLSDYLLAQKIHYSWKYVHEYPLLMT